MNDIPTNTWIPIEDLEPEQLTTLFERVKSQSRIGWHRRPINIIVYRQRYRLPTTTKPNVELEGNVVGSITDVNIHISDENNDRNYWQFWQAINVDYNETDDDDIETTINAGWNVTHIMLVDLP